MKKIICIVLVVISLFIGYFIGNSRVEIQEVEIPVIDTLIVRDTIYKPMTKANVYEELIRQEIPHAEIVLRQSLLETGNYTSHLARKHSNIFGMRTSKGYKKYTDYKECILDYKKRISSRYRGGDYYTFLTRIGYAEDSSYVERLKKIRI